MKKFLYRLGIAAGALFCLALFGLGYVIYAGLGLDKESKQFVDEAVIDITAHWDKEALRRRASPQLLQAIRDGDLATMFVFLSSLGPLVEYQGSKGDAKVMTTGTTISASYLARARYKEGEASIQVDAIKLSDGWKLLGFRVDSPRLIEKATGRKT